MYRNLDEYLVRLEQTHELTTQNSVTDRPQAVLAAAEPFALVSGLFATEKRMAWALGLDWHLDELTERLSRLVEISPHERFSGLLSRAGEVMGLLRAMSVPAIKPKHVPVQEHAYTGSMAALPPTLAQVIFKQDDSQRMRSAAVSFGDGAHVDLTLNGPTPAALVFGGDPAQIWCGFVPMPDSVDPYLIAGWVRGKPVPLVAALSQPLEVPGNAEIIIEGMLVPQGMTSRLEISAITHRSAAVLPVITAADQRWIRKACERFALPVLRLMLDEVCDLSWREDALVASIHARYPGHARKTLFGLWGLSPTLGSPLTVIVDAGTDVHALDVAQAQGSRVQVPGLLRSGLLGRVQVGIQVGIDATAQGQPFHD